MGTEPRPTTAQPADSSHQSPDADKGRDEQNDELNREDVCERLMECDPCTCCGEGWVLIGCVTICKGGIIRESLNTAYEQRKLIKLLEAVCRREAKPDPIRDDLANGPLNEQQILNAVHEDANLRLMIDKDPDFDQILPKLVESEAHRKIFKVAGIVSRAHLAHYVEANYEQLAGLVQFAKNPEKLKAYVEAARQPDDAVFPGQT